MMIARALLIGIALVLGSVTSGAAAPVASVCTFTSMVIDVVSEGVLITIPVGSAHADVTIDGATGTFTFDGGSVTIPPYPQNFALANDVFAFSPTVFSGTIDRSGTVMLSGVHYRICTLGTPSGTD